MGLQCSGLQFHLLGQSEPVSPRLDDLAFQDELVQRVFDITARLRLQPELPHQFPEEHGLPDLTFN